MNFDTWLLTCHVVCYIDLEFVPETPVASSVGCLALVCVFTFIHDMILLIVSGKGGSISKD